MFPRGKKKYEKGIIKKKRKVRTAKSVLSSSAGLRGGGASVKIGRKRGNCGRNRHSKVFWVNARRGQRKERKGNYARSIVSSKWGVGFLTQKMWGQGQKGHCVTKGWE